MAVIIYKFISLFSINILQKNVFDCFAILWLFTPKGPLPRLPLPQQYCRSNSQWTGVHCELLTAALQWQWPHLEPEEGEYHFWKGDEHLRFC